MPRPTCLVRLALALIAAEDHERAIRLRLLACARDRDHVQAEALRFAQERAAERRARASERLRAVYLVLVERHAVVLSAAGALACSA